MKRKPTRLRFTEDDLSNDAVKKAAARADRAATKAEKAVDKVTPKQHRKLRQEADFSAERTAKLRFGKGAHEEASKPTKGKKLLKDAPGQTVSATVHRAIATHEDDNVGIQATHRTEQAAETAYHMADYAMYGHKMKAYDKAEKLVKKSDKANVDALFEKFKQDNPTASSNPLSRWRQKQTIKKEYAASKAGKSSATATAGAKKGAAKGTQKAAKGVKSFEQKLAHIANKKVLFVIFGLAILVIMFSGMFSSCTAMFNAGGQMVIGTSFTAEDEDILGTEEDYTGMENELRAEIDNIESTHPGYDEYRYHLDEIGHNPYELASYLTVVYEAYTREQVQAEIARLFEEQYDLILETIVERRSTTTTNSDGSTTTTYYNYYILDVTLVNKGLGTVIDSAGLTDDQKQRYEVVLELLGNRPDIFGDDIYATPGGGSTGEYTDYDIPGEALTDTAFANMIREAEKYLGYPYVWGGSSPSTSFDCSGFVSWVVNHCGNGWSVGRQTVLGFVAICDMIPPSEAKPGDLVFFHSTYDAPLPGATHVGIYVGDGMMIHCGSPISYANINTRYWQEHFYGFGRLP